MQRDVVLRWIEQIARVIAQMLKTGKPEDLELARQEIQAATDRLLGPLALLVPRLDLASAAELLHEPERLFAYAQLLDLQATLREALGELPAALADRQRALGLARAAIARSTEPVDDLEKWVRVSGERGGGVVSS